MPLDPHLHASACEPFPCMLGRLLNHRCASSGHCRCSLTTTSKCQLDQKIMRVCISYTHPYPIKFLNHTLPFRICKLCFQANMQVTSTLWPDIKSQKLAEHQFRLRWTKSNVRTQFKQVKTGHQKKLWAVGGPGRPTDLPGRPTWPVTSRNFYGMLYMPKMRVFKNFLCWSEYS